MTEAPLSERLADLLMETGHRHHEAFLATDGADEEWPLWYAEYLEGRIDAYLDTHATKSKIVQCLLNANDAHGSDGSDQPWPTFYARYLLGLGSDEMTTSQNP